MCAKRAPRSTDRLAPRGCRAVVAAGRHRARQRARAMPRSALSAFSVPTLLLHEAESHVVTIETRDGSTYRGKLAAASDNMNVRLTGVLVTDRLGKKHRIEEAFVRGSQVCFFVLPDILEEAPHFKRLEEEKAAREELRKRSAKTRRKRSKGTRAQPKPTGKRGATEHPAATSSVHGGKRVKRSRTGV